MKHPIAVLLIIAASLTGIPNKAGSQGPASDGPSMAETISFINGELRDAGIFHVQVKNHQPGHYADCPSCADINGYYRLVGSQQHITLSGACTLQVTGDIHWEENAAGEEDILRDKNWKTSGGQLFQGNIDLQTVNPAKVLVRHESPFVDRLADAWSVVLVSDPSAPEIAAAQQAGRQIQPTGKITAYLHDEDTATRVGRAYAHAASNCYQVSKPVSNLAVGSGVEWINATLAKVVPFEIEDQAYVPNSKYSSLFVKFTGTKQSISKTGCNLSLMRDFHLRAGYSSGDRPPKNWTSELPRGSNVDLTLADPKDLEVDTFLSMTAVPGKAIRFGQVWVITTEQHRTSETIASDPEHRNTTTVDLAYLHDKETADIVANEFAHLMAACYDKSRMNKPKLF